MYEVFEKCWSKVKEINLQNDKTVHYYGDFHKNARKKIAI